MKTFKLLFLCLAANLITGCTVVRETLPERTATEQLMLSYAVRASVQGMNLKLVNGRSVFLDTTNLKSVDQEFAVGELRAALLKAGARLMDEAGQAELIVEARSATLGIDQRTTAFGVPAIPLPIPAVGIVQTPELSILKNQRQDGLSGLALTGRERATGAHVFSFDPVIGKTIKSDWRFLGFPLIRTRDQLPKDMD